MLINLTDSVSSLLLSVVPSENSFVIIHFYDVMWNYFNHGISDFWRKILSFDHKAASDIDSHKKKIDVTLKLKII